MVSTPLLTMSDIAEFHLNFSFNKMVLFLVPSDILTIASPNILSINGAFTLIIFCSFGFNILHSFGKMGKDLFQKLEKTIS